MFNVTIMMKYCKDLSNVKVIYIMIIIKIMGGRKCKYTVVR